MCGPPSPLMLINPNAICRPRNSQIQTANKSFTVHQPYNIISYLKTIQNNFNGCVFAFFLASKNLIIGRWSQCCFCYELRSIDLGFSSVPGCGTLCLRPEYQQHVTTKPIGANRKFMNSLCVFVMCDLYASLFSYFTIFIFECVGFQLFDLLLFTMTHDCSYIYIYIYVWESCKKTWLHSDQRGPQDTFTRHVPKDVWGYTFEPSKSLILENMTIVGWIKQRFPHELQRGTCI